MVADSLERRQIARAAGAGLGAGASGWLVVAIVLPAQYAHSLIPSFVGAMAGALVGLRVAAIHSQRLRAAFVHSAITFAVAVIAVAVTLLIEPAAMLRGRQYAWMSVLAGAGLIVWLGGWLWEWRRQRTGMVTALLAGLALAAALLHNGVFVYRSLAGQHMRAWNLYHYYIGSKYFAELGYLDLYGATLAADDAWQQHKRSATDEQRARLDAIVDFGHVRRSRDMRSYDVVPRAELVATFDPSVFSDARWQAFARDTRLLRPRLSAETWEIVLIDLGYNPTPAWAVVATWITTVIPIDSGFFRLIVNSDLLLYLGMFLALWWAFGLRVAVCATLWMNVIPFNRGRFTGGFLQYDWLLSAVAGLALYRKGFPKAAGVALSWGVMTRAFLGFMVVPIALRAAIGWMRRRRRGADAVDAQLAKRGRFVAALSVACAAWFGLSMFTPRGPGAWIEWVDKIERHGRYHPTTSNKRIGVGRLALHSPAAGDVWGEHTGTFSERIDKAQTRRRILQVVGFALLLIGVFGRPDEDAMVLMLFAVFLTVTLSRYYASIWILLLALGAPDSGGRRVPWPAAFAGAALLGIATWWGAPSSVTGRYFVANYEAFVMFAALCVGFGWTRLARRAPAPAK